MGILWRMIRNEDVGTAQDDGLYADGNVVHRMPGGKVTNNAREDTSEEDTKHETRLENCNDASSVLWGCEVRRQGDEDLGGNIEHAKEDSERAERDEAP